MGERNLQITHSFGCVCRHRWGEERVGGYAAEINQIGEPFHFSPVLILD